MKCLAINTASSVLQVVVINEDKFSIRTCVTQKNFTAILLPYIDECLNEANLTLKELDFFVCSIGPGSFTGIRVGLATIRGFCQALEKEVLPVTDLELLSYHAKSESLKKICITDAANGFFYIGQFLNGQIGEIKCIREDELEEYLLNVKGEFSICTHKNIENKVRSVVSNLQKNAQIFVLNDECSSLIHVARDKNALLRLVHYTQIEPLYIRLPQAERDLLGGKTN
ncbi:MAG: tRNA (adenosine(37)-N6)-threonylcarbamoyltransferase complex dimerization subunit type 1 TsaB [Firmicutes bacterium]|nr:tRNA (adenosine(37)-N6)-threonylcarbamoyltransferase complex dimerization subunit type 1 TsaB [Bacillota bacterium]